MLISHSAVRALVKFDISSNGLKAEGGKALADSLKANNIMKELNISSNDLAYNSSYNSDLSGVIAISDAIPTMGALTSLNLASNMLQAKGAKHVAEAITGHVSALPFSIDTIVSSFTHSYYHTTKGVLATLDVSANHLCGLFSDGVGTYNGAGIKALSETLKRNTSLTALRISKNYIGSEGAKVLADGLGANGGLTTITFGTMQEVTMKADMTEADLSRKVLGASGAIVVASFIPKCQ